MICAIWDEMVVESIKMYPKFHDMVKLLRQEEDDHGREYALSLLKKNNEWLGYFEYMLDMAIKNTMFIIAHVN